MSETDAEISEKALKLAVEKTRRDTIVDFRLDGHDRRLASINGQLERGAKATELVAERLQTLTASMVDLRADIKAKEKVDEALRKKSDEHSKQQVSRREFWLGVIVVVVSIVSVALNAGLL